MSDFKMHLEGNMHFGYGPGARHVDRGPELGVHGLRVGAGGHEELHDVLVAARGCLCQHQPQGQTGLDFAESLTR